PATPQCIIRASDGSGLQSKRTGLAASKIAAAPGGRMELGHALVIFQSLILISAANGAPVLFARLLGTRFARPIDGGIVLGDRHPLLGRSKTWRGLAAAVVLTACAAVLIDLPWQAGALTGAFA